MIFSIVVMVLAFYWLMYETKWLAVRLPFGKSLAGGISVRELISSVIGIVVASTVAKYLDELLKKDTGNGSLTGWYETVGFAGPKYGAWRRYVEADKKAKSGL